MTKISNKEGDSKKGQGEGDPLVKWKAGPEEILNRVLFITNLRNNVANNLELLLI